MSQPSKIDRRDFHEPSHFKEIAGKLPNIIRIINNPERLIDWDKSDLKPELQEWLSRNVHDDWTWDAALLGKVADREGPNRRRELIDQSLYLVFFFASEVDAVFFRLAHSY